MQVVFINECTSCENSNQMFFNVMFFIFKNKKQTVYDTNIDKKLYYDDKYYDKKNKILSMRVKDNKSCNSPEGL